MYEVTVHELSQRDADNVRKASSDEILRNLMKAFSEEETGLNRDGAWALPPDKRRYYMLSLKGLIRRRLRRVNYLLVGVNPQATPRSIVISSFAKVAHELKRQGAVCLRKLVEEKLVPLCQEMGKEAIATGPTNDRARDVLEKLREGLPTGIREIRVSGVAYIMELI